MTVYLNDNKLRCPHCQAMLLVEAELDYSCTLSLEEKPKQSPAGKDHDALGDYLCGIPDINFFDPFFRAENGVNGPFWGWTEGHVLVKGDLCPGLPMDRHRKAVNAEAVIKEPNPDELQRIYPKKARGINVIMFDIDSGEPSRAVSRPSIDLALHLYPVCSFVTAKKDGCNIYVKDSAGELVMVLSPRMENLAELLKDDNA